MDNQQVEILLVEDNPNDLELTLHAFRKNDVNIPIFVAHDGAEALEFLFSSGAFPERNIEDGPRLILLDLKLPKVDGLEVLRVIKKDPRTKMIPVVVLTSSHEDKDIVESYRLGANSYIVKPVDFDKFIETVRVLRMYWLLINEAPFPETGR
jgi:two-component system response regulator